MAANFLEPGQIRTGQLIDGNPTTPHQSCSLSYEEDRGPVLAVPYIDGADQFSHTSEWFSHRNLPPSLIFKDNIGAVTMTGVRWRGTAGLGYALGRLDADTTIFGQPKVIRPEYRFAQLSSKIDGLDDFARFNSVETEIRQTSDGHRVTVSVEASEMVSWRFGGFTYSIRAEAPWTAVRGQSFTARSGAIIETRRSRGAMAEDHLAAQWPLRALLVLTHGSALYWRGHHILDPKFPTWMLSGSVSQPSSCRVVLRGTLRDERQALPERANVALPMFQLIDIGVRGLRKWLSLYEDDVFRRAIEPVVEVINGASRFLEPQVLMAVLGLDAMGHFRDDSRASNVPLHRQVLRCLEASGVDWSAIGTHAAIAAAVARVNNEIKHPDRGNRPSSMELRLVLDLALVVMRLQIFDLLGLSERLRVTFTHGLAMNQLREEFRLNGVRLDASGKFISNA